MPNSIKAVMIGVPVIFNDAEIKKILVVTGIMSRAVTTMNRLKQASTPKIIWK